MPCWHVNKIISEGSARVRDAGTRERASLVDSMPAHAHCTRCAALVAYTASDANHPYPSAGLSSYVGARAYYISVNVSDEVEERRCYY